MQSLRLFFCRWGDFVDLETSDTRIVRGGGGTGGLLTGVLLEEVVCELDTAEAQLFGAPGGDEVPS